MNRYYLITTISNEKGMNSAIICANDKADILNMITSGNEAILLLNELTEDEVKNLENKRIADWRRDISQALAYGEGMTYYT